MATNSRLFKFYTVEHGPKSSIKKPRAWHRYPFAEIEYAPCRLIDQGYLQKQGFEHYFKTISFIDIATQVGGKFKRIEADGVTKVKYNNKNGIMYINLAIPEERWADQTARDYQVYIAELMRSCFQKCLDRAKKIEGEVLDEQGFVDIYENAIEEFLKMDFSNIPIGRPPGVIPTIEELEAEQNQNKG